MANVYSCPKCDFSGKLSLIRNHLKTTPEHWSVRCKSCDEPIFSKKENTTHFKKSGHHTGLQSEEIINVQASTRNVQASALIGKKSKKQKKQKQPKQKQPKQKQPKQKQPKQKIKSATKAKLIRLGVDEEQASILATGRNWGDLQKLSRSHFRSILINNKIDLIGTIAKIIQPKMEWPGFHEKVLKGVMENEGITQRDEFLKFATKFDLNNSGELSRGDLNDAAKSFLLRERVDEISNDERPSNFYSKLVGLTISNFKGFQSKPVNPQHIPIRPLTLIYGPNNGGKSSILKGFSSIPQTILKRKSLDGDYHWSPDGPWYNLGALPHVLNDPDNAEFSLGFVFKMGKDNTPEDNMSHLKKFRELRFTYKITDSGPKRNTGQLQKIKVFSGEFEDFLDPVLELHSINQDVVRDDGITEMKIEFLDKSLKNAAENQKRLFEKSEQEMNRYYKILVKLEEGELLKKQKFECPLCNEVENANNQVIIQHLKKSHKDDIKGVNAQNIVLEKSGFTKAQLRILRTFINVYEMDNLGHAVKYKYWLDSLCLEKQESWPNLIKIFELSEEYGLKIIVDDLMKNELTGLESLNNGDLPNIHLKNGLIVLNDTSGTDNLNAEIENLNLLTNHLYTTFDFVDYLSATRLIPRRYYSSRTGGQMTQGVTGERTLALLANDDELQSWVNDNLAEMIGLRVNVENRFTEITLSDGSTKTYPIDSLDARVIRVGYEEDRLQLPDVGFGVSQLLPILTGIRSKGRLVIEEPESNLHPAAQQKLMRIIIGEMNQDSKVMMETHSEHFLLEVMRAISDPECPLSDDDVSILYTYNTPEGGTVVKRHTTTNGTLDERFPQEFTGDYSLSMI